MDRETVRKMVNEFSISASLKDLPSVEDMARIDAYISKTMKSFIEEGKILRSVRNDPNTRQRIINYAAPGESSVTQTIKDLLGSLPDKLGYGENPSAMRVKVSDVNRRYWTQTTERPLDPRSAAAAKATAIRAGGSVTENRQAGTVTIFLPSKAAETVHNIYDVGDARYLAGESSSVAGSSSSASIHEKAYAAVVRRERMQQAKRQATEEFIKQNPDSELAKGELAKQESGNPSTLYERAYATIVAQERMKNAKRQATEEFIKQNPESELAKAEEAKKEDKKSEQREGAGRLAKGAAASVLAGLVTLVATSVGILTKMLGGVLETADNTAQMLANSAKYNVSLQDQSKLKAISLGLGYDADKDPFSGALGGVVTKYANPVTIKSALEDRSVASFMQNDMTLLTSFVQNKSTKPLDMLLDILAVSLTKTMAGQGGARPGFRPEEAAVLNTPIVAAMTNAEGGEMFARMFSKLSQAGLLIEKKEYTRQSLLEMLQGLKGKSTDTPVIPTKMDQVGATAGTRAWNEFRQTWSGLSETVFDKILAATVGIFDLLRNFLRPAIAAFNPGAEASTEAQAERANLRTQKETSDAMAMFMPEGMTPERTKTILNVRNFASTVNTNNPDARRMLDTKAKEAGFSTYEELVRFMGQGNNAMYFANAGMNQILKDTYRNTKQDLLGFRSLEKVTPINLNAEAESRAVAAAQLARDAAESIAKESDAALEQGLGDPKNRGVARMLSAISAGKETGADLSKVMTGASKGANKALTALVSVMQSKYEKTGRYYSVESYRDELSTRGVTRSDVTSLITQLQKSNIDITKMPVEDQARTLSAIAIKKEPGAGLGGAMVGASKGANKALAALVSIMQSRYEKTGRYDPVESYRDDLIASGVVAQDVTALVEQLQRNKAKIVSMPGENPSELIEHLTTLSTQYTMPSHGKNIGLLDAGEAVAGVGLLLEKAQQKLSGLVDNNGQPVYSQAVVDSTMRSIASGKTGAEVVGFGARTIDLNIHMLDQNGRQLGTVKLSGVDTGNYSVEGTGIIKGTGFILDAVTGQNNPTK